MITNTRHRKRRLATALYRVIKITIRFTEDEHLLIREMMAAFGLGRSELIRKRTLSNTKELVLNARELIRILDSVGKELSLSGQSVRELAAEARRLNSQATAPATILNEIVSALSDYTSKQTALEAALRKVIRALSK